MLYYVLTLTRVSYLWQSMCLCQDKMSFRNLIGISTSIALLHLDHHHRAHWQWMSPPHLTTNGTTRTNRPSPPLFSKNFFQFFFPWNFQWDDFFFQQKERDFTNISELLGLKCWSFAFFLKHGLQGAEISRANSIILEQNWMNNVKKI